jgi:uncharacterized membrane protein
MQRMLIVVFDSDPQAYKGLDALKKLDSSGDISLYANAVIKRGTSGVTVEQSADVGPAGTFLGMMTGGIVGLLGGPAGALAGYAVGGAMGAAADLTSAGINLDFMDDISKVLTPGKVAVLADVDEGWTTPVDTAIGKLGGVVLRRTRSAVVEDQLVRDSNEFKAQLKELQDEMKQANAENKAAIQKEIDRVKQQLQATHTKEQKRASQLKTDADARLASLRDQMNRTNADRKATIEKRVAGIKADLESRNAKLKQAEGSATEALAS